MRECLADFQEETGISISGSYPREGPVTLAKHEKHFPDIYTSGENEPYYTNSNNLPVNYTDDPFEALIIKKTCRLYIPGGTVISRFYAETPEPRLSSLYKRA